MREDRERLWVALSDLWLDTELDEERLVEIADVVRESHLTEAQLDHVFEVELAPFLGRNNLTIAGVWDGFDPEWVCAQARQRSHKNSLIPWTLAKTGVTTYAARPLWRQVKAIAFGHPRLQQ